MGKLVPAASSPRGQGGGHPEADMVDAVLLASRSLAAMTAPWPGMAAEEITLAQFRVLQVLASEGPQRMADLATAVNVAPSTAARLCDRLVRKGLIRRHRTPADRRAVLVTVTAAGQRVVSQATAWQRALAEEILCQLPHLQQRAVAEVLRAFADAASMLARARWPADTHTGRKQQE
ncbi:MAG TPA: MarR family transcriptional regulator [Streptosporangiaceae bacterium]|jgi:DNA-binding MarR family transcriptional regulator|nr:MarR family transcriptional regulator [Streptosporangiaceae bacterium]